MGMYLNGFMGLMMLGLVVRNVEAEKHTVRFDNRCGHGTPHLLKDGNVLSRGEDFVSNGPFTSGIAYLQTGDCNLNGEGCTLIEMSLLNPTCIGCGSSTDISLIPPLGFSVPASFSYFNGCDGQGAICSSPDCATAFFVPDDNHVQVQCQDNDVDLLITFCPGNDSTSKETTSTSSVQMIQIPTELPRVQVQAVQSSATSQLNTSSGQPSSSVAAPGPSESHREMTSTIDTSLHVPTRKCDRSHAERRASAAKHKRRAHKKRMDHERRFD